MYVINCAKGKWAKKKNTDLWEEYSEFSKGKNIEWIWVKSHNGDVYNELVDKLAKKEAKLKKK
jgi:ribonuclease HI